MEGYEHWPAALNEAILPNFDQRHVGQLKATYLELARPITQPY